LSPFYLTLLTFGDACIAPLIFDAFSDEPFSHNMGESFFLIAKLIWLLF